MRKKPSRKSAGSGAGFLLPANLRIAALLDKIWPLSTFGQNHTNSRGSSLSRATRSYPVLFRAVQSCAWLSRKLSKNYPKLSKTIQNYPKLSGTCKTLVETILFSWLAIKNYPKLSRAIQNYPELSKQQKPLRFLRFLLRFFLSFPYYPS